MKLGVIGFGQAGGKITERLLEYEQQSDVDIIVDAAAVNTAKADLLGLDLIPDDKKILIGQSRVKGHGVGADNELGATVAEEDMNEIQAVIDDFPIHKLDAFLIIAGLGGGTGSGGAPVLAKKLQNLYTEPVYGLGILPSSDEGGIYSLNAARSFKTNVDKVDNLILFDNDSWRQSGESVEGGYAEMNEELVKRIGLLFSAGEINQSGGVGETVVDASEIINTFDCGPNSITSIGYAEAKVESQEEGLLSKFGLGSETKKQSEEMEETVQSANRVTSLARRAVLGRLTLDVDVSSTQKALVVVAGPPEKISRKGVEKARQWIEDETGCMEVRGGDYPIPGADRLSVIVCLSGVTDSPRIKELQGIAAEAKQQKEEIEASSEEKLDELVQDDDEELESLF